MKKLLFIVLIAFLSGCSQKPYVIVQIADAQLGFTAADLSQRTGSEYVNDLTYESDCLIRAVDLVNEIRPDAVVFTGDQVNYADNEEQWTAFANIVSGISDDINVFHVPGNHDVLIRNGKVDTAPFARHYGEDRFIHSDRGVNLVGLNTNLIMCGDSLEGDQVNWLKASLAGVADEDVTIVFGHHPVFMSDIDEPDTYFAVKKSKRRFYFDLFAELGVDAVYAGHRHESFDGVYEGIPMKTTTSVAFQIGDSKPSVRVVSIEDGIVTDQLVEIYK